MPDSSNIARKNVHKIADLSKLSLTDEETDLFTGQFNEILKYMNQLDAVDTEGVEPLSYVQNVASRLREDMVLPFLRQDEALVNAPEQRNGHFLVLEVIKKNGSRE